MKNIIINNSEVILNGNRLYIPDGICGQEMLTLLYKQYSISYPKYYKMDKLCRLGFIASELLLRATPPINAENHGIVVIGHDGSLLTDANYIQTIANPDEYYPSPAVFVYTLANIVTGEIAIRNKLNGETSSFLIDRYEPEQISLLLETAFSDQSINSITGGWINVPYNGDFSLRFVTIDRSIPQKIFMIFSNKTL